MQSIGRIDEAPESDAESDDRRDDIVLVYKA
jgi:hypothetical protein